MTHLTLVIRKATPNGTMNVTPYLVTRKSTLKGTPYMGDKKGHTKGDTRLV